MELTPNRLVGYNLARIRRERGWTQDVAAEHLEPHLGTLWSKAVFCQAERSVAGTRVRAFTADEIVAFARAFEVPLSWFFMPPDVGELGVRRSDQPKDLLDVLFGTGHEKVWGRLGRVIREGPPALRAKRAALAGAWIGRRFRELLEARMGPVNDLAGSLMELSTALVEVGQQAVSDTARRETAGAAKTKASRKAKR